LLIARVEDQHPRFDLILGRHTRFFMNGRHVGHAGAVEAIFLLLKGRIVAVQSDGAHRQTFKGEWLDEVGHSLDWNVSLKLEADIIRRLLYSHLAPTVFDNAAWFDRRNGKRLCFHL